MTTTEFPLSCSRNPRPYNNWHANPFQGGRGRSIEIRRMPSPQPGVLPSHVLQMAIPPVSVPVQGKRRNRTDGLDTRQDSRPHNLLRELGPLLRGCILRSCEIGERSHHMIRIEAERRASQQNQALDQQPTPCEQNGCQGDFRDDQHDWALADARPH